MTILDDLNAAQFEPALQAEADARGRVTLSRAGATPGRRYQVYADTDGNLVLVPVVTIPEREMIVWQNPELRATILQGIADAENGKTAYLGDFSQYLDEADGED